MSYQIIDGKAISGQIREECRIKAEQYRERGIEIALGWCRWGAIRHPVSMSGTKSVPAKSVV